jgi:hypothetical protein
MRFFPWRRQRRNTGRTVVFSALDRPGLGLRDAELTGFTPVDVPHPELVCAVADDDVRTGHGTAADLVALRRVRILGTSCLSPDQTATWIADLRTRLPDVFSA